MASWDRALHDFIEQLEEKAVKARQATSDLQTSIRAYKKALDVATGASAKAISELIAQQEDKLEKSETKVAELACELRGARGALEAALTGVNRKQTDGATARRLSKPWAEILRFVSLSADRGSTLEEIQLFIEQKDLKIKDTAVRSQLSIYSNPDKGFVEPLGAGIYRLTEVGKSVLSANDDNP